MDIDRLSKNYKVRKMNDADVDVIFELCKGNGEYFKWRKEENSKKRILEDLHITPPSVEESDKYYVGFFKDDDLIAVMDLIDNYPENYMAFVGFFMMNKKYQGSGAGTKIIDDVLSYLKEIGKKEIRLGIDKDNPQSNRFWKKNGFMIIDEIKKDEGTILYARRQLS